jgi:hypothetical protein
VLSSQAGLPYGNWSAIAEDPNIPHETPGNTRRPVKMHGYVRMSGVAGKRINVLEKHSLQAAWAIQSITKA